MRGGHVARQFGSRGPPASLTSVVSRMKTIVVAFLLVLAALQSRSGLTAAPPLITAIPNQFVSPGEATPPVSFVIASPLDPVSSIKVVASSSNTNLFPQDNLTLLGSGAVRQIIATPVGQLTGTARITITTSGSSGRLAQTAFYIRVGRPIRLGPPTRALDGQIRFRILGEIGDTYDVWRTTNLVDWSAAGSRVTNVLGWADYAEAGTDEVNYYRASWTQPR